MKFYWVFWYLLIFLLVKQSLGIDLCKQSGISKLNDFDLLQSLIFILGIYKLEFFLIYSTKYWLVQNSFFISHGIFFVLGFIFGIFFPETCHFKFKKITIKAVQPLVCKGLKGLEELVTVTLVMKRKIKEQSRGQ